MISQLILDERNKCTFQNAAVQLGLHYPIKDTDLRRSMSAYSCPNVHFQRVLWLWLSFCWLSYLAIARSAELLKGDTALICENNVLKCITSLYNLLGKLKPLDLVCVMNQLAISGVLQRVQPCSFRDLQTVESRTVTPRLANHF